MRTRFIKLLRTRFSKLPLKRPHKQREPSRRAPRAGFAVSGTFAAALLAACSPSGAPSTPGTYPVFDPGTAAILIASAEYLRIDLSTAEENALRTLAGLQPLCFGSPNPNCSSAQTLKLQNVHQAHAATSNGKNIKGDGQLIAVVDSGFRTSHQEFAGKTILQFTGGFTPLVASHGTSVAGVAAAAHNGVGIVGVAPNANLHLSSWGNVPSGSLLSFLQQATDSARANGAIVQNNSWGWSPPAEKQADQEITDFNASGQPSYADYLVGRLGFTAAQWNSLFASYDNFQQTGVIVFANSNDMSFTDAAAWPSLPLFVPNLREAWIVVSNALVSVDSSNGAILSADLLSAPCGSAASFCLTTDGSVYAPSAAGDTSYQVTTGTSFAAPQVAGHIALLAQAFPNLSPAEWTTRLLATANSNWPGFTGSISGQTTFAPGVVRNHSSLYGLGIPDIQAALSPVGGLSISSGATIASASASSVDGGLQVVAPVVGDSIASAIAEREIMLLDQLGSDFYRTGNEIGLTGSSMQESASGVNTSAQIIGDIESFSLGFVQQVPAGETVDTVDLMTPRLLFSEAQSGVSMGNRFSSLYRLDDNRSLHFSGEITDFVSSPATSFTVSHLTQKDGLSTELSLSAGYREDSLFSSYGSGPLLSVGYTSDISAGISIGKRLSRGWSVTGFAELGGAFIGNDADTLATFGPVVHASAGIAAAKRGLFALNDRLAFYAGTRPKAISGSATLRLPVSRDVLGNIHYENVQANLAGGSMPFRTGIAYGAPLPNDFKLLFNLNADFDVPAGSAVTTGSARLTKRF